MVSTSALIRHVSATVLLVVLLLSSSAFGAATRSYLLGDRDGAQYGGPGSVDDVYIDSDWLLAVQTGSMGFAPINDLDVVAFDHNVPFTFEWTLDQDEYIVGARVEFGIRRTANQIFNDSVFLDSLNDTFRYSVSDLEWGGFSPGVIVAHEIDMSDVDGDDRLPLLSDGQLNILYRDDAAIDYVALELTTIPEPSSLLLCVCSGAALLCRRDR